MPVGNRTVLIGISERTTAADGRGLRAAASSSRAPPTASSPWSWRSKRSYMHLDVVFTFMDRDAVTVYPKVDRDGTRHTASGPATSRARSTSRPRPSFLAAVADAIGLKPRRTSGWSTTGGDEAQQEREQWDSGNNVLARRARRRRRLLARTSTATANYRDAGIEVVEIDGFEVGKGRGGGHCMTCPLSATREPREPLPMVRGGH